MSALRVGFATIYAWRPHVEQMAFLARLAQRAGHTACFLSCDGDLPACYTRELRGRPAWQECVLCRIGGVRSYASRDVASIGACASRDAAPADPAWAVSSASTLGRHESDADFASDEFRATVERLAPAVERSYRAARAWIREQRLDAVCVFNGRMDATRAVFEAARSLGVRVLSIERTWFGDGLQILPDESCLGLGSVHRLVREWRERPLTRPQALRAASYVARRFLRRNDKEWRAFNVEAEARPWPSPGGRRRLLLIPSSRGEVWGHPDWETDWPDPLRAYEALMAHLGLEPADLVLRCHPNWAQRIGRQGGERAERFYADWATRRGIAVIGSADRTSTLELIRQSEGIVVANGSAALEAGLLGKQVIAFAPSTYQEAGFRDSMATPEALRALRLHADLPPDELVRRRDDIARRTLRFAYCVTHRIPQYTREVRADSTTRYRYAPQADPARFDALLRGGELRADDDGCADGPAGEDGVLRQIAANDWQGILDAVPSEPAVLEPIARRLAFRPVDAVRPIMPVGDL